ncbi:hypothetical protein [Methanomassiliicoccus luminyensis]|uniref:hypothetical protein n=1 Tax=Methanomassiliicoccus luminyensis TaxID=1080712 RepID=UPI00038212ED|nr:hypothetical protein [Methanomassiliicoccus luminyensis]
MSITATLASSAISIEAGIGLGVGGVLVAILLITLLSSKELISSSKLNSPKVRKAMNLAIVPLLAVFTLNVAYVVAF